MQAAPCLARPAEGVRGRAGRGLGAAATAAAVAARRMRVMGEGGGEGGGGGLEFDGGGRGGQGGFATATAAAVVSGAVVRYGERVVLMAVMEVRVLVVLRQSEALVGKLHSRRDFTVFISSVADLSQRGLALAEDKVGVGRVQVKVPSGVAVLLLVHHPN